MSTKPIDKQELSLKRWLKNLHLAGTLWFILCVSFILIRGLRRAGYDWLVIFSLSGHSVVILFMLVSVYLFALFRGGKTVDDGHAQEHPLTSSGLYMMLYTGAPLLGAVAGLLHMALFTQTTNEFFLSIALWTFRLTFGAWVILDPIIASLETFTPQGRLHRAKRLEKQKAERLERQRNRDALLDLLVEKERENEAIWTEALTPYVPELCDLLNTTQSGWQEAEQRAAEIAVTAWRLGGLACMQFLHQKALAAYQEKHPNGPIADYIINWWDGIGAWRNPNAV
ncbi:MAG: hypothetical protein K9N55_11710 [Phycisphaerae bacterium]|nr:hypothetical protein [Phycisphaerae bacterium]